MEFKRILVSKRFTVNTVIDMNIGAYQSNTGAVFPGAIDLVALYSKVLTPEEIWNAYNNPLELLTPRRFIVVPESVQLQQLF